MRVGVYVRSKNEINTIEFIEHYFGLGFDFILFLDHMSITPIKNITDKHKDKDRMIVIREDNENLIC
jgi:hypothetical protein